MRTLLLLVPSLRISGGNVEAVRLAQDLERQGTVRVVILTMWRAMHSVDTGKLTVVALVDRAPQASRAWKDLPQIFFRFVRYVRLECRNALRPALLLTHYTTFPLAWLRPSLLRVCFNQDLEWLFVVPGFRRTLLKRLILFTSRRSLVITPNRYITAAFREEGIDPFCEASIWADERWLIPEHEGKRDLDVLMLLRESTIKRLDLYEELIERFQGTVWRLAAITPDSGIADRLRDKLVEVHERPTNEQMQELYARARTFLLLSDVEGFGLPPLEAMGAGCCPVCRDCGGVRCYMDGAFAEMLLDRHTPIGAIVNVLCDRLTSNRLPSPTEARRHFAAGLAASRESRQRCIAALAKRLA